MKKSLLATFLICAIVRLSIEFSVVEDVQTMSMNICSRDHDRNLVYRNRSISRNEERVHNMAARIESVIRRISILYMSPYAVARAIASVQWAKTLASSVYKTMDTDENRSLRELNCNAYVKKMAETFNTAHNNLTCILNEMFLDVDAVNISNDGHSGYESECATRYVSDAWPKGEKFDTEDLENSLVKAHGMYKQNTCSDIRMIFNSMRNSDVLDRKSFYETFDYMMDMEKAYHLDEALILYENGNAEDGHLPIFYLKNKQNFKHELEKRWPSTYDTIHGVIDELIKIFDFGKTDIESDMKKCNEQIEILHQLRHTVDALRAKHLLYKGIPKNICYTDKLPAVVQLKNIDEHFKSQINRMLASFSDSRRKHFADTFPNIEGQESNCTHSDVLNEFGYSEMLILSSANATIDVPSVCTISDTHEQNRLMGKLVADAIGKPKQLMHRIVQLARNYGPMIVSPYAMSSFFVNIAAVEKTLDEFSTISNDRANCWEQMVDVLDRLKKATNDLLCAASRILLDDHEWHSDKYNLMPIESTYVENCAGYYVKHYEKHAYGDSHKHEFTLPIIKASHMYVRNIPSEIAQDAHKMPEHIFRQAIKHFTENTREDTIKQTLLEESGHSSVEAQRIKRFNDYVRGLLSESRWEIGMSPLKTAIAQTQNVAKIESESCREALRKFDELNVELQQNQFARGLFRPIKMDEILEIDTEMVHRIKTTIDSELNHQMEMLLAVEKRRFRIDRTLQKALHQHEDQYQLSVPAEHAGQKLQKYLKESNAALTVAQRTIYSTMFWRDDRFESPEGLCNSVKNAATLRTVIEEHIEAMAQPSLNVLPDFSRRSGAMVAEKRKKLTDVKNKISSDMKQYLDEQSNFRGSDGKCTDIFTTFQSNEEKLKEKLADEIAYFPVRHDDEDLMVALSLDDIQRALDLIKVGIANERKPLPIQIGKCTHIDCLEKEIEAFKSSIYKRIQEKQLKGENVNEQFKKLIGMIRILHAFASPPDACSRFHNDREKHKDLHPVLREFIASSLHHFADEISQSIADSKIEEYHKLKLDQDLIELKESARHDVQKGTRRTDTHKQCVETMAALAKALTKFEHSLQTVGVFIPPLVSEEYPVSILEILSAFFDSEGVVKQMSELVWERIKKSSDAIMNELPMLPDERLESKNDKIALDDRLWTIDGPDESEDAYAYQKRLRAQIHEYYAALYEITKTKESQSSLTKRVAIEMMHSNVLKSETADLTFLKDRLQPVSNRYDTYLDYLHQSGCDHRTMQQLENASPNSESCINGLRLESSNLQWSTQNYEILQKRLIECTNPFYDVINKEAESVSPGFIKRLFSRGT